MAKFFRKLGKEIGQTVDVLSIDSIKSERNELERERERLQQEIVDSKTYAESMRSVADSLEGAIAAQDRALLELRIAFERVGHAPRSEGEHEKANQGRTHPKTEQETRLEQVDHLFFLLTRTQQQLTVHCAGLGGGDVVSKQARIAELTVKIDQMNARLQKIRQGG